MSEFSAIEKVRRAIDGGAITPIHSGPLGSYFRGYSAWKNRITQLAIEMGIDVSLDGSINGRNVGPISLIPLFEQQHIATRVVDTGFSSHVNMPVAVPELLCLIDLVMYPDSGSGQATNRQMSTLDWTESGICLEGQYRWLPPLRITPGRSTVSKITTNESLDWSNFNFLKYAGEDIDTNAHPLEFRTLFVDELPQMLAFRVCVGEITQEGIKIPMAFVDESKILHLSNSPLTDSLKTEQRALKGQLASCLVARQPQSEDWILIASIPIEESFVSFHASGWLQFLDMIRPSKISVDSLLSIANSVGAVAKLGGEISLETQSNRGDVNVFALACAAEMRYPKAGPAEGLR